MITWLLSHWIEPSATTEPHRWFYAFGFEVIVEAPLVAYLVLVLFR